MLRQRCRGGTEKKRAQQIIFYKRFLPRVYAMRVQQALKVFFINFQSQDGVPVSPQDGYSCWIRGAVDRHDPPNLIMNDRYRYMSHLPTSFCLTQLQGFHYRKNVHVAGVEGCVVGNVDLAGKRSVNMLKVFAL